MKSLKQFMEELSMVTIVMIGELDQANQHIQNTYQSYFDIPHIYTGYDERLTEKR